MKKILCMLMVFCLVLVMGACSNTSEDNGSDEIGEAEVAESIDTDSDSGVGIDSEYVDLELLREDPIEGYDEGFFLLRDGINYDLATVCHNEWALNGTRMLYDNITDVNSNGQRGFCSVGEVPVPILEDDDLIVCYSKDRVPILGLKSVDFYGYTTGAIYTPEQKAMRYCANTATSEFVINENVSDLTFTDSSGNVAEDMYNLNQNDLYTVSWYEGTQYREVPLVADSKMYVFRNSEYELDYEIEGSLTKDGYAVYDLSGVAPGTYKISVEPGLVGQGLITIE